MKTPEQWGAELAAEWYDIEVSEASKPTLQENINNLAALATDAIRAAALALSDEDRVAEAVAGEREALETLVVNGISYAMKTLRLVLNDANDVEQGCIHKSRASFSIAKLEGLVAAIRSRGEGE